MIRHHFTVDVEEYFQVSALEPYAPYEGWTGFESRVEASMDRLLALLDGHGVKATFFTLGWIAERHPDLVRRLAVEGHEVASHGSRHERVTTLSPKRFRECVRTSKAILEDVTGVEVRGYRAPSFSIHVGMEWAYDVLVEEGYAYDSSMYPGRGGHPLGPCASHPIDRPGGRLTEYPIATVRLGRTLPAGGGAYLRLLPFTWVRSALLQAERAARSATLYIHPWEIDPDQPRFRTSRATRIRHYGGLARTEARLSRLLEEFAFGPILSAAAGTPPAPVAVAP